VPVFPNADFKPVARFKPGGSLHIESHGQRRVVLHTAVSNASSKFKDMNVPGNETSHFYINRQGKVEQYVDTAIRSSANFEGNPDCITIESWDGFGEVWHDGDPVPPWNDDQLDGLVTLVAWLCMTHDIPVQKVPSSLPGTRGIGWHRIGIDGNFPATGALRGRVKDGEHWSKSFGKLCPGDAKIRQVMKTIIPGVEKSLASPSRFAGTLDGGGATLPKGPKVNLHRVQRQARALHPLPGVKLIQKALNQELNLSLKVNGLYDPATKNAYKRWQHKQGFTGAAADGVPGELTLGKLGKGRFTVVSED
jgi:hypothetical protein